MTTLTTRGNRLLSGSALFAVSVSVVFGLLWGMWRLLSWTVVAGAHHPFGYAAGVHREAMPTMGGYGPGMVTPGDVLTAGIPLLAVAVITAVLLVALLLAMGPVEEYRTELVETAE